MINALQEPANRPDVTFEVGTPQFMRVFVERHDLAVLETLQIHRADLRRDHRPSLPALKDHHPAIKRTETVPQQHLGRLALDRRRYLGTRAFWHAGNRALRPLRRE